MSSTLERRLADTEAASSHQRTPFGRGGASRSSNRGRHNPSRHHKAASDIVTKHSVSTVEVHSPQAVPAKPAVEVIATGSNPKEGSRRGSRAKAPTSNTQMPAKMEKSAPASPTTSTASRSSARRKRQQSGSKPNKAEHVNGVTKDTQSRQANHLDSPTLSKDLPPHLTAPVSTSRIAEDVNALVERVRAGAMERPSTPGSHIDWADEDDSLPDLDDWMKAPSTANSASHLKQSFDSVISPLVMDGLKSLPDDIDAKTGKDNEGSLPSNSLFPPTPSTPHPNPSDIEGFAPIEEVHNAAVNGSLSVSEKESHSHPSTPAIPSPLSKVTSGESADLSDSESKPGLSASIHAPKPNEQQVPLISSTASLPSSLNSSQNRPQNAGWANPPMRRVPRSGNHSPLGGSRNPRHFRTQSTPPMRNPPANPSHRMHASRPVITGDAMSRLAKTIGSTKI